MQYYSLNRKAPKVSFKEAVISGIAPDRGLYFPEKITPLPKAFFENTAKLSLQEIAYTAMLQFVEDDIPQNVLRKILRRTLDFDFPLIEFDTHTSSLELFHGPTMAFKDVGARFMANCLGYFTESADKEVTVLVATSGDTGSAVANGFLGVEGTQVVILYPSGKVSEIQEKQLTTLGKNIRALEVQGTFDDCQRMVKRAFLDEAITKKIKLTSANSINLARWLPQMIYYLAAYQKIQKKHADFFFSVPSGNYGNICAGMLAQALGMPAKHFVAATNCNDVVPRFMHTQDYDPKPSIATISNAMDVGDPSNFIRIQELYGNNFKTLKQHLSAYSFTDLETKEAMRTIYKESGYIADPHGAVAYLGLKKYQQQHPDSFGIFLETAHPIKFLPVVNETLNISLPIPERIEALIKEPKFSIPIANYAELSANLLSNS